MDVRFAIVSFILLLATTSLFPIAKTKKTKSPPPPVPNNPPPPLPSGGGGGGGGGDTPVWPPGRGGGDGCSCWCSANDSPPRPSKVFVVGGTINQWSYGTNYTDWALKNAPFYVGDVLEFKYPEPVRGRTYNHSVHLLRDRESYQTCNLSGARKIGDVYAGGGPDGFKLTLETKLFPILPLDPFLYFACGEKNGLHCSLGTMKFAIMPLFTNFP